MTGRRGARRHEGVVDVVAAALAVLFLLAVSSGLEPEAGDRPVDALGYAVVAMSGSALAVRRRWPLTTVAVVVVALSVYVTRGYPGGPVFATLFVALYSVAAVRGRRVAFASAGGAAVALVVVGELAGAGPGLVHLVFVGWSAAAVFLGDAMRSRRGYLAALEERAVHLEQSREEEARRRVAEDRLRIAQDLHDSVAHSMAVINVQAGVAEHVIDRHPDRAREALGVIRRASSEVLDELAALVGLLRLDAGSRDERAPTPAATELPALVASARRGGLEVSLHVDGDVGDVPQPIGVALYRIVQESLTNVVRHAGAGATATVTVTRALDGGVSVEIADDGGQASSRPSTGAERGAGVGLVGLRERAVSTGGWLTAGPRREGGFVVGATWPGRP